MDVKIVEIALKHIVCVKTVISLANDQTVQMWQAFMPRRKEITGAYPGNYSVQVYRSDLSLLSFTPATEFIKWAAVEVPFGEHVPKGMLSDQIAGGKYAVFVHRGPASDFPRTAKMIFEEWLPSSEYELDHRPHFEFMDPNYLGPMHPDAEEEVYIPIK